MATILLAPSAASVSARAAYHVPARNLEPPLGDQAQARTAAPCATVILAVAFACRAVRGHRTGPARGSRTLCRAKGSRALTVMEEVEEWKNRPMEATVLQQGLEMERRFGRPYFDEKRGIGKVCDWLPHRGFGYLLCGSPPEKIIFRASDVPQDYLASKGGKVPMEADVEFNLAGTWRGRKRAKDLVFPMAGNFTELGLKPEVIEGAANSLGLDPRENPDAPALLNPAPVQQEAIPYILNGDNIVIAAETGSGKSLAYMLPMVQIIRGMAQARNMDYGLAYRAGCPLALAICPTRELAMQAYRTLKLISHHAKCRVRLVHGGSMTWRKQRQEISQVVDILVCTPDRWELAHEPYHGRADFRADGCRKYDALLENRGSLREVICAVRSHLARNASTVGGRTCAILETAREIPNFPCHARHAPAEPAFAGPATSNPSVAERRVQRAQGTQARALLLTLHVQERSRSLSCVAGRFGPVQEVMQQRLPAAGRTAAPPSAAKRTGLLAAEQVWSSRLAVCGQPADECRSHQLQAQAAPPVPTKPPASEDEDGDHLASAECKQTAVSSKSAENFSAQEEGYDFGLEEVPMCCRKGDGCRMYGQLDLT
ncbi:RH39 [Symbiodinium sp. CCMP2592]|nr:RH39 [Symbiodinium sp. CCMP2592]